MIFKSRISLFYLIIIILTVLLLMVITIGCFNISSGKTEVIFSCIISITTTIFLLSITFNTKYTIQEKVLKYRSGPLYGQICIQDIKAIQLNATKFIGLKIALASKGMIIKYNRWNDIYISPKAEQLFIQELLKINPDIHII